MAPTTTALTIFKATPNTQSRDHISKTKNSSENTSTPRKASVGTTTSADVAQPQATTVPSEAENIQPPPPGISAEGTCPLNQDKDRDARAYEHERQKAKHAGEWAKRRARKATTQVGRPARASAAHAGRRAKNLKGGKVGLDVAVDVYAVLPQKNPKPTVAKIWEGLGASLLKRVSLPPSGGAGADASKATQDRVNLSELVVLSQRKARKLNADDFEVIPHIRSVIALDDVTSVHDMDLDEPWEHIYATDEEGKTPDTVAKFVRPSYARVVGTGCQ